ncbi:hippocampus abundant transcript-like protein 1 [Cajanus cajan]|uniref:Hippocampus abundant transcript-like protein 1 n=1 Tax=Cajanus cajan TaxID=3821 RepID=A0A151TCL0_CAJCA|nr:hippocampus abundant transcript-like protein 1 [Cajanus cajan]KYP64789.1 Hippocampus abundant transcript-like protein 1 [Cajanus cajan]
MDKLNGLSHLFMTMFLHNFAVFMVVPAITDVTMTALCPGQDECSLAIYLTGFQQAMIGVGTLVMMPLLGNLSDKYGRKAILTVPMTLTIIPIGILAYSRTKKFFYVYYVFKILISMVCEGSVPCLALAYVADNIPESGRSTAFGILSGIGSAAFVCGTLSARFLSTALTFQVSTLIAVIGAVYMKFFLQDSIIDDKHLYTPIISQGKPTISKVNGKLESNKHVFKALHFLKDLTSILNSSLTITQAAIVAFFSNLADVGLHGSMMYFLKARFHFDKNQFADLMVISGIAGTVSQLLLMPILAPILGEARLLSIGLFFHCIHMFLYSIAWSSLVPYASAMFSILFVFSQPCIRSIVSKQVGPHEQGKAQGCISGICSVAHIVSPLVFSPLTALFLSEKAPFDFPGFSIMCIGFASMISFVQSMMLRVVPPISS